MSELKLIKKVKNSYIFKKIKKQNNIKFNCDTRIIFINNKQIKLTKYEACFLENFKNTDFVAYKDLIYTIYGKNLDFLIPSLKEIKSRLYKKTGINFITKYKNGYQIIDKIDFIEKGG